MTKKINYIKEIHALFYDSRNHGKGGNNWWYPTPNVKAYNVKMRNFADIDDLRKEMSTLQNDYYTDEDLRNIIDEENISTCQLLKEDTTGVTGALEIDNLLIEDVYYAGRSGGWLEVEYTNTLQEFIDDYVNYGDEKDIPLKVVNEYYKKAKELVQLESDVAQFIQDEHKKYNNYVGTTNYYKDLVYTMLDDENIKATYKKQADTLLSKIA